MHTSRKHTCMSVKQHNAHNETKTFFCHNCFFFSIKISIKFRRKRETKFIRARRVFVCVFAQKKYTVKLKSQLIKWNQKKHHTIIFSICWDAWTDVKIIRNTNKRTNNGERTVVKTPVYYLYINIEKFPLSYTDTFMFILKWNDLQRVCLVHIHLLLLSIGRVQHQLEL